MKKKGNNKKHKKKDKVDFIDFAEKSLYIRTKNNAVQPFKMNREQRYIIDALNEQKQRTGRVRALILKGRQIGITTLLSARGYYNCVNYDGYRALILTHRQTATNNVFDIINRYHNYLEDDIKPEIKTRRNQLIDFIALDSSIIFATAGGIDVARSETIQYFHGSEVAFWKNANNHLLSIMSAIPDADNTEIILESTSNGPEGLFYEMCMQAQKEQSEFLVIFIPWFWHENYFVKELVDITYSENWLNYSKHYNLSAEQLQWAYKKNLLLSTNTGEDPTVGPCFAFYKEFPASLAEAFKYSKYNILIPLELIHSRALDKNFHLKSDNSSNKIINQFLNEQKIEKIILGVDIARGGGDFSWIIDRQGSFLGFNVNEKVNMADTMQIVGWIEKYIKEFSPYKVCIDAGGGGVGVYDRLKELGYNNILLVHFASKSVNPQKYLNKRAELWCSLKEFLSLDNFIVEDSILFQQLSSLEYTYTSNGQIQLEKKEKLKQRIKQSPDGADAAALTFATDSMQDYKVQSYISSSNNDFNPFDW
jgi:hypothetical protein